MPQPNTPTPRRAASRAFVFALTTALAFCAGAIHAAEATTYERALASGKAKLEAGQVAEALRDLQEAVQADGSQSDGFFYLAVASFRLGDHAAALEYGNAAVAAAQEKDKPRAAQLVDAIRKAKETEELARQADEAQGKGLNAKAADLYARAFQFSPDRGDLGLKAATLYANRLNRLLEAAVLFQGVISSGDATAANTAGSELGSLHERLQQLYREELPRAVARSDLAALVQFSKAFPDESQPRVEVASLYAAKGDGEAVAIWLGEAVKLGTGYEVVQTRSAFLDLWEKNAAAFKSFIGDAFGATAVSDMDQRLKTRQARQAEERRLAAEKARIEQLAREEKNRQEQLAQEKAAREAAAHPLRAQLRQPLVTELNRLFQGSPLKKIQFKHIRGDDYDSWIAYDTTIGLQGNQYALTSTQVDERMGGRLGHRVHRTTNVATFDSFSPLNLVTVEPDSFEGFRGSNEKLRMIALKFAGYVVANVGHNSDRPDSPSSGSSQTASGNFFIKDVADGPRIAAIVVELKAIDSLSLEQLREKTGVSLKSP